MVGVHNCSDSSGLLKKQNDPMRESAIGFKDCAMSLKSDQEDGASDEWMIGRWALQLKTVGQVGCFALRLKSYLRHRATKVATSQTPVRRSLLSRRRDWLDTRAARRQETWCALASGGRRPAAAMADLSRSAA